MGGSAEVSIDIQLVKIVQVRSVDQEQGTGIDHIAAALMMYAVTQAGHNAVFVVKRINITITVIVCV
jgi:hypothetical protein